MRPGSRRLSAGCGCRRVTVAKFPVCSIARGPWERRSGDLRGWRAAKCSAVQADSRLGSTLDPGVLRQCAGRFWGIKARARRLSGRQSPRGGCTWEPQRGAGRGVASPPPGRDLHVCGGPRLPAPSQLQVRAGRAGLEGSGRAETRAPPHPDPGRTAPPRAPVAASLLRPPRSSGLPGCEVALRPSPPSALQSSAPSLAARSWATLPPRAPEGRSHERNVQLSSHRGHSVSVRRGLSQWLHQHFGVSEPRAKRGASGPLYQLRVS